MAETYTKRLVLGMLAHVDAGKTTLSERMLYSAGRIRRLGRVDKGDAYLDTDQMEKERGITIFSKMATLQLEDIQVTLLDTPGHVDFSAEMEKTLSVLDYAILLINGADGVQGHTETLWQLLTRYHVPAFLFVNKMDQPGTDRQALMKDLEKHFGNAVVDFSELGKYAMPEELKESIAMCDEQCMEKYLESGVLEPKDVRNMILDRKLFPVFFGSALKGDGVEYFLEGLCRLTEIPLYPSSFAARVFKIGRDSQGHRLSYMKITGGELRVRTELPNGEKVPELRFYSGAKYTTANAAEAGSIVAVPDLQKLKTGDALGCEPAGRDPSLELVLDYELRSEEADPAELYRRLQPLSDEFPELHIRWDSEQKKTHVRLMGEVQTEILKRMVADRFGFSIDFSEGDILYRETIAAAVEGVGHFEPLRHYAEVHLLMEPLPRGSGLQFRTDCSTDALSVNWQRLILTHLREKEHAGVLTGSPLTDIRITVIAGRAHDKHTEGGDFREATYRAVRQGLRRAESILLEPYYAFTLEVPEAYVGRAMTDLSNRHAHFDAPAMSDGQAVLEGTAPVVSLRNYHAELVSYTKGRGRLFLRFHGYDGCHDTEAVQQKRGYDPDRDLQNPCGSVFCAHGTGFLVPWQEVESYMHVPSPLTLSAPTEKRDLEADALRLERLCSREKDTSEYKSGGRYIGDQELEDIFVRTYGPIKNRAQAVNIADARTVRAREKEENREKNKDKRRAAGAPVKRSAYLLVDGYNIIFAWPELKELAAENLDAARGRLLDILSNYAAYTGRELITVFDAYRVAGHVVETLRYHNISVVYTREAMTADEYIEQEARVLTKQYDVTVATSDQVVQVITLGAGAVRWSAETLLEEVQRCSTELREEWHV